MENQSESSLVAPGVWAFVLNRIVIDAELPYEFLPGCTIDVATEEQRNIIRSTLNGVLGKSSANRAEHFYESEVVIDAATPNMFFHQNPIPEAEWMYYVVTTPDNGQTNINLSFASNVSRTPLELTALYFGNGGCGHAPYKLTNHFFIRPDEKAQRVSIELLKEIKDIYERFIAIAGGIGSTGPFPEIQRAMEMYDSINLIPRTSDFVVLGLFAIIEMLITHNPKLEDRGDSITHQMQSKIPLLSHRFDRPIDHAKFFPQGSEKKLWSALYSYRSAVAHGGTADFSGKEQVLVSAQNVQSFLREVVKSLLRHSLVEPDLYRDIREC